MKEKSIRTIGDLQEYCESRDNNEQVIVQIIDIKEAVYNVHAALIDVQQPIVGAPVMTQLKITHPQLERIIASGEVESDHNQAIDRIIEELHNLKR